MIVILDIVQLLEVYQTESRKQSLSVIKSEGGKFPTQVWPIRNKILGILGQIKHSRNAWSRAD
jgi:hypothetical protein